VSLQPKAFDTSIEIFDELIVDYPMSDKIATAFWKKALSLLELKKTDEADAVLKLLITKYPLEEEAKSAQQKIQELRGRNERHEQPERVILIGRLGQKPSCGSAAARAKRRPFHARHDERVYNRNTNETSDRTSGTGSSFGESRPISATSIWTRAGR